MRRSSGLVLVVFVLSVLLIPRPARADSAITVRLDGQPVTFEVAPMIQKDRTYVPVRFVLERIRAEVDWDAVNRRVLVRQGARSVQLTIGQRQIQVDGQVRETDVAPFIHQDRTMVPLRLLAEAFGFEVGWDAPSRTVLLRSPVVAAAPAGTITVGQVKGAQVDDVVTIPVRMSGVSSVRVVALRLTYDPVKLVALQVRKGQAVSDLVVKQEFNNQTGTVEYVAALLGDAVFTGDGVAFEVLFRTKAPGTAVIGIAAADPSGALVQKGPVYAHPVLTAGSVTTE